MSKIKLKEAKYDEATGISTATIITDLGEFTGASKLHEEDREIVSTFAGCGYAEQKALLKYMRAKVKIIKEREIAIENTIKVLQSKKDYNHNSVENRTIRKQLYLLRKVEMTWKERISSLHDRMYQAMMQRIKIVNAMMEKGEAEDNG